jgi:phosphatidate cytidylyltransferase
LKTAIAGLGVFNMKQKIITGAVLAATLFPALYFGGWLFEIVIFVFLFIGALEFAQVKGKSWPKWMKGLMVAFVYGLAYLPKEYFMAGVILLLLIVFFLAIQFEWFDIFDLTYVFTMVLMVGIAIQGVRAIQMFGSSVVVYIAVATYATDTGAYFIGVLFGKHKLNPRISPKKTIEGSIAGWIFGTFLSLIFAYFYLTKKFDWSLIIAASIILPPIGQIGDLAFSAIKRYFNVKDFGTIFPSHGGVLDRIDSLLFNFMAFYALLILFV